MDPTKDSPGTESKPYNESQNRDTVAPDSPSTQKDMFGIPMNENTNQRKSLHSESSPYQTEGMSTEFKNDQMCRLDMDPRHSKRSVRFGEQSEAKSGRMGMNDDDSE